MLTRRALLAATAAAVAAVVAACGSKGDLVLPRAGAGTQPPPAATTRSPATVVPIQPAIPSSPAIPPETLPPSEPKQP